MKKDKKAIIVVIVIVLGLFLLNRSDQIGIFSNPVDRLSDVNRAFFDRHGDDLGLRDSDGELTIPYGTIVNDDCMDEHDEEFDRVYVMCLFAIGDDLFECYDGCDADEGAFIDLSFLTIIPSAYAIVIDPFVETCYDRCDDEFYDEYYDDLDAPEERCALEVWEYADDIGCVTHPEEMAEYHGEEIRDINEFYQTNFPIFYEEQSNNCIDDPYLGEWVATVGTVGCVRLSYFSESICTSDSIGSAGDVCETVGGTFNCEAEKIVCTMR